jgi:hypothetical protein
MKRIITLLLLAVMTLTLFAGCTKKTTTKTTEYVSTSTYCKYTFKVNQNAVANHKNQVTIRNNYSGSDELYFNDLYLKIQGDNGKVLLTKNKGAISISGKGIPTNTAMKVPNNTAYITGGSFGNAKVYLTNTKITINSLPTSKNSTGTATVSATWWN